MQSLGSLLSKNDQEFINTSMKGQNMSFLPDDYKEPKSSGGNYMKFVKGQNKIRIMSDAITGMEYWKTDGDKRTPIRLKPDEVTPIEDLEKDKDGALIMPKHFWAFVVWNYQDEAIQILEITQRSIQKAIRGLTDMDDWGNPIGYDITITRDGEGLETRYSVMPGNKKNTEEGIDKLFEDMPINLNALYDGEDPFEIKDK